ncbi:MAG: stage 0 sporulation family protein [Oscillospiraceae bacterium]|nr:stage 0 sporulation family protein [Oscillospiraceae bacterium]
MEIIGVRFNKAGKVYYFTPKGEQFKTGDKAVVETTRGLEMGNVVFGNKSTDGMKIEKQLKSVTRKATAEDISKSEHFKKKEAETFKTASEKIAEHNLEMKLVDVEYTFDGSKILFYFTAEGRVDFRELVRTLAGVFRTRIEFRQIGVRDESKHMGGYGVCGRNLCCSSFLDEFHPVSIKMAKEQGLSLNPVKISGVCGRLMCCLQYEHEVYEELLKVTPNFGSIVKTPDGEGMVVDVQVLKGMVRVKFVDGDAVSFKPYEIKDLKVIKRGAVKKEKPEKVDKKNSD